MQKRKNTTKRVDGNTDTTKTKRQYDREKVV